MKPGGASRSDVGGSMMQVLKFQLSLSDPNMLKFKDCAVGLHCL